jgi:hypothetical protein
MAVAVAVAVDGCYRAARGAGSTAENPAWCAAR